MEEGDILKKKVNTDFVYGTRAIIESIGAGIEIERLYIQRGLKNKLIEGILLPSTNNDFFIRSTVSKNGNTLPSKP